MAMKCWTVKARGRLAWGAAPTSLWALLVFLGAVSGACSDDSQGTPSRDGGAGDGAALDAVADGRVERDGSTGNGAGHFGDVDNDGYPDGVDCDDHNAAVHPDATELCGNVLDDDCDGVVDEGCLGADLFHVDVDSIGGPCSDEGPGTIGQPWCTVAKANDTLSAGQTVLIRQGTYVETIQPARSGTSNGSRITYAAYEGEEVTFTDAVYCVRLQGVSFITIVGITFYDCERNLYISGGSDNNVTGCVFDTPRGPTTWAGSRIYDGSTYNRITHCTFSRYGAEGANQEDSGAILDIGSDNDIDDADYNLIANSTFFHGGHHILGVYSSSNVVRNNTFHNEEWFDCHRSDIGGLCGNRNVITNTSYPERNIRNVFDKNYIVFSGVPPDQATSAGLSLRTQWNIVRQNLFYHCDAAGVALSNDGGNHNDASHNYLYHNVFYHNGYPLVEDWDVQKSGLLLARWVDDAQHNPMTGVAIKNNVFHDNQLHAIYYYYVDEAEQDVTGNWLEEGDPAFVDLTGTADPFDFEVFDFRLQAASPCVENGEFLTTTVGAGTQSTTIALADASYFSDGNGMVVGDYVQLEGKSETVLVTHVDYASNSITINFPMTWSAGTGVALPYSGARPDQGAFERGE